MAYLIEEIKDLKGGNGLMIPKGLVNISQCRTDVGPPATGSNAGGAGVTGARLRSGPRAATRRAVSTSALKGTVKLHVQARGGYGVHGQHHAACRSW